MQARAQAGRLFGEETHMGPCMLWHQAWRQRKLAGAGASAEAVACARRFFQDQAGGARGATAAATASGRFLQDRISSEGELITSTVPRVPGVPSSGMAAAPGAATSMVPDVPPLTNSQLDEVAEFVQTSRGVLVLTGAGCSTESRIPDYRGPAGAYLTGFKPMSHQQFMASEQNRRRYWARSFAGWVKFSRVEPNAAHEGLARLQQRGWVEALITQNVDRLHHQAGSREVLELHGTTHEVVCMQCGQRSEREAFQRLLAELNPSAAAMAQAQALADKADYRDDVERMARAGTAEPVPPGFKEQPMQWPDGEAELPMRRPDGDMELVADAAQSFIVPPCPSCGGFLKPDVVFFGDGIPEARAARSLELAANCRALLVVGSSLAVWSAFRLAKTAVENGAQLGIITAGQTRADALAHYKWEARAGETMARLAAHPALLLHNA